MDGEGLIASSSRPMALTPPSEDTHKVFKGSSSRYRHSEAAGDGEKKAETADAARTVARQDEPISELETPEQRPTVLPPSNPPAQSGTGLALFTDASLQPEESEHNRTLALQNATSPTQTVANYTAEVSDGLDMPSQQADYLRILHDKFGTPGPNHGHLYSDTDDDTMRNVEDGNCPENFVDDNNESNIGRRSLKSVSYCLLSMLAAKGPQIDWTVTRCQKARLRT
jgi:hypothetical protein